MCFQGLRSLFLEGNGINSLAGLAALRELRCLYVQQNCIEKIEHLETLAELDTLNIRSVLGCAFDSFAGFVTYWAVWGFLAPMSDHDSAFSLPCLVSSVQGTVIAVSQAWLSYLPTPLF